MSANLAHLDLTPEQMLAAGINPKVWKHAPSENDEWHWSYYYDDDGECLAVKKVREKEAWENLPPNTKAKYNHDRAQYIVDTLEEYADETWKVSAMNAVQHCAEVLPFFDVDDVWDAMDDHDKSVEKPYVMGVIMRSASIREIIYFTGTFITYRTAKGNHATPARVWTGNPDWSREELKEYRKRKQVDTRSRRLAS